MKANKKAGGKKGVLPPRECCPLREVSNTVLGGAGEGINHENTTPTTNPGTMAQRGECDRAST